jgi:hypothetical protein
VRRPERVSAGSVLYFAPTEAPPRSLRASLSEGMVFMRPNRWSFAYALAVVSLTLILAGGAWAQPKYKVIATRL